MNREFKHSGADNIGAAGDVAAPAAGPVTGFQTYETAWCPGCGNFSILACLQRALTELGKDPHDVLLMAGIGQAAKITQYISVNSFSGLHGRALPAAAAAGIANDSLTIIVSTGDGDTYGEGGNHFIHNIRRNVDMSHFVHDNQIYGLTKGQVSPTSQLGHVTDAQTLGNLSIPLNPVLIALAAGAGFVARAFTGNPDQLTDIMKQAILYRGYALVDIIQPCVSFNKVNTFADDTRRIYPLPEGYAPTDLQAALLMAQESGDHIPTGVFYKVERPTFCDRHPVLASGGPLLKRSYDPDAIRRLLADLV